MKPAEIQGALAALLDAIANFEYEAEILEQDVLRAILRHLDQTADADGDSEGWYPNDAMKLLTDFEKEVGYTLTQKALKWSRKKN